MSKFCSNCGKELSTEQDVCLGCGKIVSKEQAIKVESKTNDNNHNTYKTSTGIIMIVLGICLVFATGSEVESPVLVFTLPGIFGLIGGILNLITKKNPKLLIPSALLMFLGAVINFIGIRDISIYAIFSIVFGIVNIIYSKKENK